MEAETLRIEFCMVDMRPVIAHAWIGSQVDERARAVAPRSALAKYVEDLEPAIKPKASPQ